MSLQRILTVSFLSITAPIGIMSNIMVIIIFYKQNHFTVCSNIFFMHLAIVDLLVCIFGGLAGASVAMHGGFHFCKFTLFITVLFYGLSTGNLCLLTYDRYMYISKPLKYFQKMDPKRAKTLIAVSWTIATINIIPVLTNTAFECVKGPYYDLDIKNCILPKIVNRFYLSWITIIVVVFLLATVCLNLRILAFARGQRLRIEASQRRSSDQFHTEIQSQAVTRRRSEESTHDYTRDNHNSNNRDSCYSNNSSNNKISTGRRILTKVIPRRRHSKALRTILGIVIIHCLCTLPYVLFVTTEIICGFCFEYKRVKFAYSLYLFNYLNSVFDPVIYVCLNSDLRRAVRRMLRSACYLNRCN